MIRLAKPFLACAAALSLGLTHAQAQHATPVSQLDLHQFTGTWYQIARLPDAAEKKCVSDGMVLYALSDKPRSFQAGLFCKIKGGDAQNRNTFGKQNKRNNGELKVSRLLILSTRYEVLANAPDYSWAVVGTSNHKSLWLLARTPTLEAATRTQLEQTATAAGYRTAKLLTVPHTTSTYRAEAGAPTGQGQPVAQDAPR